VAGLKKRFDNKITGLTVMSCDNLPSNGRIIKQCVLQFASKISSQLADWIERNVTFPSTVIDRIVPATTENDIALLEQTLSYRDEALVVAESFSQWTIEDDFACGRPQWELVGAQLVSDAEIYELIKLRLLNGTHSVLAYAGYLAGKETIADVMSNPVLERLCTAFMRSAASTITAPENFDIEAYQQQLHERFANPGLKHRTWQIAMDGSQKIPQRWLNTLADIIAQNGDIRYFAFALACWMKYISGEDEQGQKIDVSDPLANKFSAVSELHFKTPKEYVSQILSLDDVFSAQWRETKNLELFTCEYLREININGVLATLRKVLQ
jgi:fructuronate reductase